MVHPRVLEAYINLALIYMSDNNFPVIPIKDFMNADGDPTTAFKPAAGTKPPI